MRDWAIFLIAGAFLATAIAVHMRAADPVAQPPEEVEVSRAGEFIHLRQDARDLYIRAQSITGFSVFAEHPFGRGPEEHPVIFINLGAKEYRFDVANLNQAASVTNAIIGE